MPVKSTMYEVFRADGRAFYRTRFAFMASFVAVLCRADYAAEGEGWINYEHPYAANAPAPTAHKVR